MQAESSADDKTVTSVPINHERRRESGWTTLDKNTAYLRFSEEARPRPHGPGRAFICISIMFLLVQKSSIKGFLSDFGLSAMSLYCHKVSVAI